MDTASRFNKIGYKKSYFLFVLLPFLLIAIYIVFLASDRYVSSAGFAVRNMDNQSSTDLLGSVTGLVNSGSSTSDSYIIIKYLESLDLLKSLMEEVDFLKIYGRNDIDILSRIPEECTLEERLKSWKRYIKSSFDPTSGIIRFEVHSFNPEDSFLIASYVLEQIRNLTNDLSEQAREDAIYYAKKELKIAENRLLESRINLSEFRANTNSVDLSASAMAQIELLANLEKELIDINARIQFLMGSLNIDAPSIRALEKKAQALESQIIEKRGGLKIIGQSEDLSSLMANQEGLDTEKAFSESAYASAMSSLEAARIEASRNQRYLAIYSQPYIPESPEYPKKLLYCLSTFVLLNLTWGLITIVLLGIKDHLIAGWVIEDINISSKLSKKQSL